MPNQSDPVCGMSVREDDQPLTTEYAGQTYLFCSDSCRDTFEKEPERYAVQANVNDGRKKGAGGI